jgi:hypothetical protein
MPQPHHHHSFVALPDNSHVPAKRNRCIASRCLRHPCAMNNARFQAPGGMQNPLPGTLLVKTAPNRHPILACPAHIHNVLCLTWLCQTQAEGRHHCQQQHHAGTTPASVQNTLTMRCASSRTNTEWAATTASSRTNQPLCTWAAYHTDPTPHNCRTTPNMLPLRCATPTPYTHSKGDWCER